MEMNPLYKIPGSERELAENIKEAESSNSLLVIKLSYFDIDGWGIYEENNGKDGFIMQYPLDPKFVMSIESNRRYHQFDKVSGVHIDSLHGNMDFFDPGSPKYASKVEKLKKVKLWKE